MTSRLALRVLVAAAATAWTVPCLAQGFGADDRPSGGTLMRWFTDSDRVSVRSMSGDYAWPFKTSSLNVHVNNERVVIPAVAAPPGTQDAVDAITTASRPISGNAFQDFVKLRNEVQGEYERGPAAISYYLSTESDYVGQQFGGRWNRDYKDQTLNLSLGSSWSWDDIQPVADDDTRQGPAHKSTLHWNAVVTEVMSPTTLLRYGLEYNLVNGLQHNPYRNVYAGGTQVAERHPEHRQRRDAFVRVNHALPNRSSLKLNYRFYNDDWGIASHEVGTRLSQYLTRGMSVRWEYRWYTQTAAEFYRDEYTDPSGIDGFRSGDYRMNELASHLFGGAVRMDLDAFAPQRTFIRRLSLWFDVERYFNSNNYSANIIETGVDFRFP